MKKSKKILLWVLAFILTLTIAYYQRTTGPTYPVSDTIVFCDEEIDFKLPRSHGGEGGKEVRIEIKNSEIKGLIKYKRYKSYDDWSIEMMSNDNGARVFELPHQPPAGKIVYEISLIDKDGNEAKLTDKPIIIRFKGHVPMLFLLPHIIMMFLAMVFSARTGLEALTNGNNILKLGLWTCVLLFFGGIVMGPIIQKYAFDAFWTGWPIGHDLTDNKTVVALIIWLVALWRIRKNGHSKLWAIIASLMLLIVFLIPHSVLGSELDYTSQQMIDK